MKYISEYNLELLKQNEPYLYYLSQKKCMERGNSIDIEGPLPCVINIQGIETASYNCMLPTKSIHEDAIEITYVILKLPNACFYDNGIEDMIECGMAATKDKLIPDLIYSDHDYISDDGKRHTPYFKPDYSPHTLGSRNYMGDLVLVRREVLMEALSQNHIGEYDNPRLALWALIKSIADLSDKITHVTETLWYIPSNDESEKIYSDYEAAFSECASKIQTGVTRNDYKVSIIIPSKDHSDILIRCLESIKIKSGFNLKERCDIVITDNGSYLKEREKIEEYIGENPELNIKYIYEPCEFNYAAMCNRAVEESSNELLLFLNDDIEAVSDDFIDKMARYAFMDNVGAVGAKLLYPKDNLIQHIGVTSLKCGPTHKLTGHADDKTYYFGVNKAVVNTLAVTGACMMITREKYFQVNGFYDKMEVSYNDVDLCVNLYEKGLYNVVLNDVILLHHESLSRGSDLARIDKYERLGRERDLFYERHNWLLEGCDPFYNINLIQDTLDYRPNVMPDYEIRDKKSQVEVLSCKRKHKAFRDRLKFSIEKTSIIPSFDSPAVRFTEIEGWSLFLKKDDRRYRRYMLFIPESGDGLSVSLMPKLRTDVGKVFTDEKYTDLAGFVLRIPEALLEKDKKYRVALMYEHKVFKNKVIAYGNFYEPGRGYGED